jgi:RNA polymerase sigma-70 factor, ECF subfamily
MSAGPTSRPLTDESDWDLVVAAKNGKDRAFEILIRRYEARMLSLALGITRNREDAQDVVQQSFQKAFVHLQKFQGKSAFSTWLQRIAINEALMCLRKNRVSRTVSLEELNPERDSVFSREISDAGANPEETCIQREKERILSSVIDKLPRILQRAVRLHLDDLTAEEVGQILGVRIPTVKARLFRGRQKASRLFKRHLESPRNRVNDNLETVA